MQFFSRHIQQLILCQCTMLISHLTNPAIIEPSSRREVVLIKFPIFAIHPMIRRWSTFTLCHYIAVFMFPPYSQNWLCSSSWLLQHIGLSMMSGAWSCSRLLLTQPKGLNLCVWVVTSQEASCGSKYKRVVFITISTHICPSLNGN